MSEIGDWICLDCGHRYGRTGGDHLMTTHIGHCDYCDAKDVTVVAPRDFGYPKLPERAEK